MAVGNFDEVSFDGSIGGFDIDEIISSGGKGDNGRDAVRRREPFKPTGLIDRPKLKARKDIEDRIQDARDIQAEVSEQVAREFGEESKRLALVGDQQAIEEMSLREIDAEIGVLLRKKIKTQEDELMLILLMAAAAAA